MYIYALDSQTGLRIDAERSAPLIKSYCCPFFDYDESELSSVHADVFTHINNMPGP